MKLLVTIPTLSRSDLLIRNKDFLESIEMPDEVLILDNGHQEIDIAVPIERSPKNLGVGGSWNFFLRRAFVERDFDGLVLLQDDIIWNTDRLESARRLLVDRVDVQLFLSFHQFSIQVHRPSNLDRIGLYDDRFWPAYAEDDDYAIRMSIASQVYHRFLDLDPLPGSQIEGTPKTIDGMTQFKKLVDKWGDKTRRINVPDAPYYVTNRGFFLT